MTNKKLPACTVYKSNALIGARYRLGMNEMRLILSCIGQVNSTEELMVTTKFEVSAKEFAMRFNLPEESTYSDLKDAAKTLFSRSLTIYNPDPDEPGLNKIETRWISSIAYIPAQGRLVLRFALDILPYLGGLKGRFTGYELEHITNMKSTYGIRLYELLMQWRSTGRREIAIDWLKEQFELDNDYDRIFDLKKRVIDPAVKDINNHSNYNVNWVQRKTGRAVTHLTFFFSEKQPENGKPKRDQAQKEKHIFGVPVSEIEKNARPGETSEQAAARINKAKKEKANNQSKTAVQQETEKVAEGEVGAIKTAGSLILAALEGLEVEADAVTGDSAKDRAFKEIRDVVGKGKG